MGALLGYKLDLGVKGIWLGMLAGSFMQIAILSVYVLRANWRKEVCALYILHFFSLIKSNMAHYF